MDDDDGGDEAAAAVGRPAGTGRTEEGRDERSKEGRLDTTSTTTVSHILIT